MLSDPYGQVLGHGSFGTVVSATRPSDLHEPLVAIKMLDLSLLLDAAMTVSGAWTSCWPTAPPIVPQRCKCRRSCGAWPTGPSDCAATL